MRSHHSRLGLLLVIGLAAWLNGCTGENRDVPTAPTAPTTTGGAPVGSSGATVAAKTDKAGVCHTNDEGDYKLLNVSGNALSAHLEHGDGQPGDPVPGGGFVLGPACELLPDTDGDGTPDHTDTDDDNDGQLDDDESACGSDPLDATSLSPDFDDDGVPDCTDPDDDNDGVSDADDAFPFDPTESRDTDGDGIGDNSDPDADGDGQSNVEEIACGSDPFDAASLCASPTPLLDQAQEVFGGQFNGGTATFVWQQGVTAGLTGQVTGLELYFHAFSNHGVSVYLNRGAPWQTDAHDWAVSIPAGGLTSSAWNAFDLTGSAVFVNAGDQLSIGIHGQGPSSPTNWFGGSGGDAYPGGTLWIRRVLPILFPPEVHSTGAFDMAFRLYVDPTP
jgi:hypothetical protein